MIEKKVTAGEPSSAPPAFNWDLSQGEWYTVGDFPYWKTIMSRKTRGVVASNVKAEFAERIVKAINAESGAAQEVSPVGSVQEIRPRPDDPSCQLCGAQMVVKEWKCLSCQATTVVEEVSPPSPGKDKP